MITPTPFTDRKIFFIQVEHSGPDMGKSGHESRVGHDFLTLKRLQKSRDQVVTRDHFAHVCSGLYFHFQSLMTRLHLSCELNRYRKRGMLFGVSHGS